MARENARTPRPRGTSGAGRASTPTMADSSTTRPPSASQRRKIASASVSTIFGSHRSGTAAASRTRPRSSRDSPPLGSSQVGAHQATTCDWARVRAT